MRYKNMAGETDLRTLICTISPSLLPSEYVFVSKQGAQYGDFAKLHPIASFQEEEGLTIIIEAPIADANQLYYEETFRCITLGVHSDLIAVGFIAKVSTTLAYHNIAANFLSAYHHDHVFVRSIDTAKAVEVICGMSASYAEQG
jgi:hypothetical protein